MQLASSFIHSRASPTKTKDAIYIAISQSRILALWLLQRCLFFFFTKGNQYSKSEKQHKAYAPLTVHLDTLKWNTADCSVAEALCNMQENLTHVSLSQGPKGLVQHGVVWVNHQWIHCSVGENASVGIENPSQKSLFWNKCFYKWGNIVSLRHTVMLSRFSSGCLMAEGIKVCWIFHICCGLKKRTLVPWVRCRWQLQTQHLLVGQAKPFVLEAVGFWDVLW